MLAKGVRARELQWQSVSGETNYVQPYLFFPRGTLLSPAGKYPVVQGLQFPHGVCGG